MFRMLKLFRLIKTLFEDGDVTSIDYAGGRIWVRRFDYAEVCPSLKYYSGGSILWRNRVEAVGRYPSWQIRLVAMWLAGAGLRFRQQERKTHVYGEEYSVRTWSLDLAR